MSQTRLRRVALSFAAALLLPVTLGAMPSPSADVRESYELLSTTFYSKVSAQSMLDGAQNALLDELRKNRANATIPRLRDTGHPDENVREIVAAIDRVQSASHASATDLTYAAIDGMARSLHDRYTQFFTPQAFQDFNNGLDPEKISGIGVMVDVDPATKYVQAYYVVPGTPADKAGIESGDLFTAIDGTSTRGFSGDDARTHLRGKSGSVVHLEVMRDGKALPPVAITRSEVQPPTVIYRMLAQHVAYISILQFGKATPDEFNTALARAQSSDVRAYVIDLRNDGGGYVNSALAISERFIDSDPLLTIEERGQQTTTVDASGHALPRKPMAILVNGGTASASEITAGALQDDGVAVLVGERTFGKGVMQSLTQLPDGAAIKITVAHYLTPKNRDINLKGIQPDYAIVENPGARYGEPERDAQLQAALTIITKKVAQVKN